MRLIAAFLFLQLALPAWCEEPISTWFNGTKDRWIEQYKWLHTHPELSFEEANTAKRMATAYRDAGFEVTKNVGGHGVVAMLANGEGPTVMLRCDMDALPIREQTLLPYASTATAKDEAGIDTPTMHACGHDIHMTVSIATANFLSTHRDQWSGTLMLIAQPAEERGSGATAMLGDGLFTRFPKPDYALALHVGSEDQAGTVKLLGGYTQANVDSVDITMKGRGGHGSKPHTTIDPIVQAADLIMSLQMIVAREIDPQAPAVVTVGSIHGGTKHNIIGDQCHLQLTVRSYSNDVREHLLESIRRRANAIALAYNAPEPEVTISEGTPSLRNDDALVDRLRSAFESELGKQNVGRSEPSMGGEDFSQYGLAGVPICLYRLGTIDAKRLKRFERMELPLPSLHSALYYPDPEKSLLTGVRTMAAGALELMPPRS
ncbi:MAG: amidohydrolase [Planctomycetota bacterium]